MSKNARSSEQGIALVFTLFLMGSMSALAVSLMFLAQTETSSTRNYRTMSQARYAGEAGVHKAINYFLNGYIGPTAATLGSYNLAVSPVRCASGCTTTGPVVLSSVAGVSSNYPDAAVATAFNAAAQGSLAVGSGTVTYAGTATLISMRQVTVYGGGTGVIQTWEISAAGTVPGAMPATVEVTAMLERNFVPADTYAIFATGEGCGAVTLAGGVQTDSYDSTNITLSGGVPVVDSSGGAVGTNGNVTLNGNVTVNGNVDTPRTGVGTCKSGTPNAFSGTGQAAHNGSLVQLPQPKTYPAPELPSPLPPITDQTVSPSIASCAAVVALNPGATCTFSGSNVTITTNGATPLSFGNLSVTATTNVTIAYGVAGVASTGTATVNLNSINITGGSTITIASGTSMTMNVVGTGKDTPIDFSGGALANASFDPSRFQILYAGTGEVKMVGGSSAAATVYAPNAEVVMAGSADLYGSVLSNRFRDTGGAKVHYDRSLSSKFFTLGNYVMTSFSWKKY